MKSMAPCCFKECINEIRCDASAGLSFSVNCDTNTDAALICCHTATRNEAVCVFFFNEFRWWQRVVFDSSDFHSVFPNFKRIPKSNWFSRVKSSVVPKYSRGASEPVQSDREKFELKRKWIASERNGRYFSLVSRRKFDTSAIVARRCGTWYESRVNRWQKILNICKFTWLSGRVAHIFCSAHTFHSIYGQWNAECTNRTSHPFITLNLCRLTVLWLISSPRSLCMCHTSECVRRTCVCVCVHESVCLEASKSLSQICLLLHWSILPLHN